jgi:hypothetical protein
VGVGVGVGVAVAVRVGVGGPAPTVTQAENSEVYAPVNCAPVSAVIEWPTGTVVGRTAVNPALPQTSVVTDVPPMSVSPSPWPEASQAVCE